MADLLIRGGKLPKYGCAYCFLRTGNYCGELSTDESVVPYSRKFERHPDCPLVGIPDHGRLIDADALDQAFTALRFNEDGSLKHWDDRKNWCLHGSEIEKLLAEADTIIPASKEGES